MGAIERYTKNVKRIGLANNIREVSAPLIITVSYHCLNHKKGEEEYHDNNGQNDTLAG